MDEAHSSKKQSTVLTLWQFQEWSISLVFMLYRSHTGVQGLIPDSNNVAARTLGGRPMPTPATRCHQPSTSLGFFPEDSGQGHSSRCSPAPRPPAGSTGHLAGDWLRAQERPSRPPGDEWSFSLQTELADSCASWPSATPVNFPSLCLSQPFHKVYSSHDHSIWTWNQYLVATERLDKTHLLFLSQSTSFWGELASSPLLFIQRMYFF